MSGMSDLNSDAVRALQRKPPIESTSPVDIVGMVGSGTPPPTVSTPPGSVVDALRQRNTDSETKAETLLKLPGRKLDTHPSRKKRMAGSLLAPTSVDTPTSMLGG